MLNRTTLTLLSTVIYCASVSAQTPAAPPLAASANAAYPASQLSRAVAQQDNMQPSIPRPEQDKSADENSRRCTKKPANALIFFGSW